MFNRPRYQQQNRRGMGSGIGTEDRDETQPAGSQQLGQMRYVRADSQPSHPTYAQISALFSLSGCLDCL